MQVPDLYFEKWKLKFLYRAVFLGVKHFIQLLSDFFDYSHCQMLQRSSWSLLLFM